MKNNFSQKMNDRASTSITVGAFAFLLIWIISISFVCAQVYQEHGLSGVNSVDIGDYSFQTSDNVDFSQVNSINETNVHIISGKWNISDGQLILTDCDYLLWLWKQKGVIGFSNLIGTNNNTIVENTYVIQNPTGNTYYIVYLMNKNGNEKINVKVNENGFTLKQTDRLFLDFLAFSWKEDFYSYPGANSITNPVIQTVYDSNANTIKFIFNGQTIIDKSIDFSPGFLSESENYYGGLMSENEGFSITQITYQNSVTANQNLDVLQFVGIMLNILVWGGLPGLTDTFWGMLINILVIKIPGMLMLFCLIGIVLELIP